MVLTVAEREHQAFARILSEFGFSDTEDVPVSAVLRAALVQLTHEIDTLRAAEDRVAALRAQLAELEDAHTKFRAQLADMDTTTIGDGEWIYAQELTDLLAADPGAVPRPLEEKP